MEVAQCYKYRYPGGVSTKVPFTMTKPGEEKEEEAPTASSTPATSEAATTSVPTTTTSVLKGLHEHYSPFRTTKSSQSRNIPQKS